jgi:hypothetical protein
MQKRFSALPHCIYWVLKIAHIFDLISVHINSVNKYGDTVAEIFVKCSVDKVGYGEWDTLLFDNCESEEREKVGYTGDID